MSNHQAPATKNLLTELRTQIARLERGQGRTMRALPFGLAEIDVTLPAGGLRLGGLHEIAGATNSDNLAAATAFAAGILGRLAATRGGQILWCRQDDDLYPPGLAWHGLGVDRVLHLRAHKPRDMLIALEEGLRHRAVLAVLGEVVSLPPIAARRLSLAAEAHGGLMLILRRSGGNLAQRPDHGAASALTRWQITSVPSADLPNIAALRGIGRAHWRVALTHNRGGFAQLWELEACDETGCLAVPALLGSRTGTQDAQCAA